jgi:hypothetical protein
MSMFLAVRVTSRIVDNAEHFPDDEALPPDFAETPP